MKETLFTRLASYSQNPAKQSLENFTTEVLVHLINNDKVFRRIFIRHIIRDGRIQRRFRHVSAESQQRFENGIVDIVLSASGSPVFVEVKIAAAETETKICGKGWVPQVQKYLDLEVGHVAYLTTKAVSAPDLASKSKRYLRQSYFEDLYDHLAKAKPKLTDCGRLFLDFMEENNMKSLKPFTTRELVKPESAFDFARKCESFLKEIKSEVEPKFREMFRSRSHFIGGSFSPYYDSAYTKVKLSGYKKVKQVEICICVENGSLVYGVWVRILRTDIERFNRHLKWTQEGGYLFHSHPCKSGRKSRSYIPSILSDLRQLKRALNRVY